MLLNPDFQFSQSSLQDYSDCPRRFELKYIRRMAWPALQSEPVLERERQMELGQKFHRLVHQHHLGITPDVLSLQSNDPDLGSWWQSYLQCNPLDSLPLLRLPEYTLRAPFAGFRLIAKFDLLAIEPGLRAVIIDWKTARFRSSQSTLRKRIQTRLYPFVLAAAGAVLNGGVPLSPSQIQMMYWFPEFPDRPEQILYSIAQFEEDRYFLQKQVEEICTHSAGAFWMAEDEKRCLYCEYRSYCGRGCKAGCMEDDGEFSSESIEIDFGQLEGTAF